MTDEAKKAEQANFVSFEFGLSVDKDKKSKIVIVVDRREFASQSEVYQSIVDTITLKATKGRIEETMLKAFEPKETAVTS